MSRGSQSRARWSLGSPRRASMSRGSQWRARWSPWCLPSRARSSQWWKACRSAEPPKPLCTTTCTDCTTRGLGSTSASSRRPAVPGRLVGQSAYPCCGSRRRSGGASAGSRRSGRGSSGAPWDIAAAWTAAETTTRTAARPSIAGPTDSTPTGTTLGTTGAGASQTRSGTRTETLTGRQRIGTPPTQPTPTATVATRAAKTLETGTSRVALTIPAIGTSRATATAQTMPATMTRSLMARAAKSRPSPTAVGTTPSLQPQCGRRERVSGCRLRAGGLSSQAQEPQSRAAPRLCCVLRRGP
mmetsp:Transcript_26650/g.83585  ORF Transcript_26650/g.83585 Transcript_26650/m.83585 type:complete len:299 (-) Transcript_26650:40-936(-)